MLSALFADLRYAARTLRRSPVFTAVAIVSLALGLGANASIFNLFDQILLRPLPVQDPAQLVLVESPGINRGNFDGDNSDRIFSYPMYTDIRDRNQVFSGVLARYPRQVNIVYGKQSEAVQAEFVSGNYFDVLGIAPFRGRLIAPRDDDQRAPMTAVLGYGFWQRRLGGDLSVLGQTLRVNSNIVTVVGIAPPSFFGVHVGGVPDIYVPLNVKAQALPNERRLSSRSAHWLHLIARLKPGVTRQQANAALAVLYPPMLEADLVTMPGNVSETFRKRFLAKVLQVRPAHNGVPAMREESGDAITIVMAMAGLVLLIACANVANLLVARALGRQKEIAIRLSMGADRRDLVRQLLVESLLLSLCGCAIGLIVAVWTSDFLLSGDSGFTKTALTPSLDPRTLAFTIALSVATGLLFGLIPALQATRPNVNSVLKDQGGAVVGGFRQIRSRQTLVVAQVALSLLLLIGAGLFTRSLLHLRYLDPGFSPENMVVFSVDALRNGYDQPRIHQLYADLQERLGSLPGMKAAAASDNVPMGGNQNINTTRIEGYVPKDNEGTNLWYDSISPAYFATLGVPMVLGREFGPQDLLGAKKVAIVNESTARDYFHNQSPIGRHLGIGSGALDIEIVGVVKDTHHNGLQQKIEHYVYVPCQQDPELSTLTFQVRTAGPPAAMLDIVRKAVAQMDPTLAIWDLKTMDAQLAESLSAERMLATLCASFGILATILAAVGLYGVTAFNVARRTREIGIRMALGAARQNVLSMVLREVAILCLAGLAVGLPVAYYLGRLLQTQLYGVQSHDVVTFAGAVALLLAVSLAAGLLPARRAATVDPMVALRYE